MAGSSAHFLGEEAEAQRACDLLMIAHQVNRRAGARTQASQATQPTCLLRRPRNQRVKPLPLLGAELLPQDWGPPLAVQALGS